MSSPAASPPPHQPTFPAPNAPSAFPHVSANLLPIAEAMFQRTTGSAPAARLTLLATDIADLLRYTGTRARLLFQLCLWTVMWCAPLFIRRLPPLRKLPVNARIAALTQMEKSPLGAAPLLAIKALLCTLYYEQPDAAREIGADDACDANASIPPGHTPRRLPLLTAVTPSPAAPTHGANS
jgi:hypothetical protein